MSSDVELHLAYQVGNAVIHGYPYPHFFVRDVFPADYYARLQEMLPDPAAMAPLSEVRGARGYDERFLLDFSEERMARLDEGRRAFWEELRSTLLGSGFAKLLLAKFGPLVKQRFGNRPVQFHEEALLVQDTTNYKLGPHTDVPRKVLTLLFYLPRDESQRHLGTSMYLPKDRAFRCPGGPHYAREGFDRVWTQPFLPNSLFAFFKTDASFHGVEPVADPDCRRWLLLYDIYHHDIAAAPVAAPAVREDVKFSF